MQAKSPYALLKHLETYFACKHCGRVFKSQRGCAIHASSHVRERLTKKKLTSLKSTVWKTKQSSHMCKVCGRSFNTVQGLAVHGAVHKMEQCHKKNSDTTGKLNKCQICRKHFSTKRGLNIHNLFHSKKPQNKGKSLTSGRYMLKQRKAQKCKICGKIFNSPNVLAVHSYVHKKQNYNKDKLKTNRKVKMYSVYKCQLCMKIFKTRHHLAVHKLIHAGKRSLKSVGKATNSFFARQSVCLKCGEAFQTRQALNKHKALVHRRGRPPGKLSIRVNVNLHHCGVCGKLFGTQHHLAIHSVTHRNISKHFHKTLLKYRKNSNFTNRQKCTSCGKVFATKRGLAIHAAIHNREFSQKTERMLNVRQPFRTEVKCHKCETCGKIFQTLQRLAVHRHFHKSRKSTYKKSKTVNTNKKTVACTNNLSHLHCGLCGKTFKTHRSLVAHNSLHSQGAQKSGYNFRIQRNSEIIKGGVRDKQLLQSCKVCGKAFRNLRALSIHSAFHRRQKIKKTVLNIKHEVFDCDYELKQQHHISRESSADAEDLTQFQTHEPDISDIENDDQFQITSTYVECKSCGDNFKSEEQLAKHYGSHIWNIMKCGDESFSLHAEGIMVSHKCLLCRISFESLRELASHACAINGDLLHQCHECENRFASHSMLTSHYQQQHSELQPHVCNLCGKAYRTSTVLMMHYHIHI